MELIYDIYISKDSFGESSNKKAVAAFSAKLKTSPENFVRALSSRRSITIARNKTKQEMDAICEKLKALGIKAYAKECPPEKNEKETKAHDTVSSAESMKRDGIKFSLKMFEKIETYTIIGINYVTFFPIILINKFFKRRFTESVGYLLLAALSFIGIYHLAFQVSYNIVYNMAYDFSFKSLIGTATAYGVFELLHKFTPLPGVGKIADWLADGLIALSIQTILLKIVKDGFVAKYVLSVGFLLCAFQATKLYGKRIVISAVFVYVLLPGIVSLEAATYKMTTESTYKSIKVKYEQHGGATQLILDGLSSLGRMIFGSSGTASQEASEFAQFLLESLVYLLVMTTFYCIISPFIAYILISRILRKIFQSDIDYLCYDSVCQASTKT